jgi:hypothetical protein
MQRLAQLLAKAGHFVFQEAQLGTKGLVGLVAFQDRFQRAAHQNGGFSACVRDEIAINRDLFPHNSQQGSNLFIHGSNPEVDVTLGRYIRRFLCRILLPIRLGLGRPLAVGFLGMTSLVGLFPRTAVEEVRGNRIDLPEVAIHGSLRQAAI